MNASNCFLLWRTHTTSECVVYFPCQRRYLVPQPFSHPVQLEPLPCSTVGPHYPILVTHVFTEAFLDVFDIPGHVRLHLSYDFSTLIPACSDCISAFLMGHSFNLKLQSKFDTFCVLLLASSSSRSSWIEKL